MNIKRNDNVVVLAGKDKGKTGKVLVVNPSDNSAVVQGVNIVCKNQKPRKAGDKGGIMKREGKVDASNLQVICQNCGKKVEPLSYTSRNHCPFCLYSLHVDVLPGDRANECGGKMRPVFAEPDAKKGYIITHKCEKCGQKTRNKAAHEAKVQPDDTDLLIRLTAGS